MLRALACALLLAGCFFKPDEPVPDDDANVTVPGTLRRAIQVRMPRPAESFPVSVFLDGDLGLEEHAASAANIEFRMVGGGPLPEIVDEPRIASVARSPAWIQATFANLADRLAFMSIAPE